jgi:hypothetical protein
LFKISTEAKVFKNEMKRMVEQQAAAMWRMNGGGVNTSQIPK